MARVLRKALGRLFWAETLARVQRCELQRSEKERAAAELVNSVRRSLAELGGAWALLKMTPGSS